jgi:hypothetical protein
MGSGQECNEDNMQNTLYTMQGTQSDNKRRFDIRASYEEGRTLDFTLRDGSIPYHEP